MKYTIDTGSKKELVSNMKNDKEGKTVKFTMFANGIIISEQTYKNSDDVFIYIWTAYKNTDGFAKLLYSFHERGFIYLDRVYSIAR